MSTVEQIADWTLYDHDFARSPIALRQARLLLLDSISCAYAAIRADAASAVLKVVDQSGGHPQATVIGSPQKTSAVNAAFANGVLVRVLDLNDVMFAVHSGHLNVSGHRSDNIPAALAVAEMCHAGGAAVLDAIILNYELFGLLRDLMLDDAPWDAVSVSGMVAAAMCGRIMGLDASRLAHALALAAVRSPTPKIVRRGEISAAKSLANAFAMQAGLHSAMLAANGVTGPLEAIDDKESGLFQVFDSGRRDATFSPNSCIEPAILYASLKTFPCIGTAQAAVQVALDLRASLDGRTDEIVGLQVTMVDVPVVRRQQQDRSRRRPTSREAADHSFPYLISAAPSTAS